MDQLSPQHVPVYETGTEQQSVWTRCVSADRPVVAVRDARRGYIVRYDLQHLDAELTPAALRALRRRTRTQRSYPTGDAEQYPTGTDPISETEGIGGEAGSVSGELHTDSETDARELASRLSAVVFDQSGWTEK
jgi:hypothetical protein